MYFYYNFKPTENVFSSSKALTENSVNNETNKEQDIKDIINDETNKETVIKIINQIILYLEQLYFY